MDPVSVLGPHVSRCDREPIDAPESRRVERYGDEALTDQHRMGMPMGADEVPPIS